MPIVRAGDADIAWEESGTGDPLLMIMGLATDSRMWMLQVPSFAERYRVITFDNRGVGMSSVPPGPYTMEQMAADAIAVLDAAGVDRAHVVGISMGGAIAQHLALKVPERVRSLVLAATWCSKNAYLERMDALGRLIGEQVGHHAIVSASMLFLFTPKLIIERPEFVGMIEAIALDTRAPPEVFRWQTEATAEHHTRDQLASLDIPTLVVVGRRDIFVPPELSMEVAAAIPGAEFRMLEAGHAFVLEEGEEFNAAVLEFLAAH